jgi:peptidoglycan hydrolase-like protein with peptidoglycan-binding domain
VLGWYRIADGGRFEPGDFGRKSADVRFVGGCLSAGDQVGAGARGSSNVQRARVTPSLDIERDAYFEDRDMTRRRSSQRYVVFGFAVLALAVVAPAAAAGASSVPHVRAPHTTLSLSSSTLLIGQSVTASIVVKPRVAGQLVTLQRQGVGHWRNLAQALTNAKGKVTLKSTLTAIGNYKLRASVAATALAPQTISPSVVVDVEPNYGGSQLVPGESSAKVLALQQRLSQLGYWLGTPDGYFGDATEEAIFALQKVAGIPPNGEVGPSTVAALEAGDIPAVRSTSGYEIEIDLTKDLVMFVNNGVLEYVINTSTGGGYTYVENGVSDVATTPTGMFSIIGAVNGTVTDTLGTLWRPRFFYEGFAIHGDSYVPAIPVSHGCARVSNEAIDWIWANNLAPIGTKVWVYGTSPGQ